MQNLWLYCSKGKPIKMFITKKRKRLYPRLGLTDAIGLTDKSQDQILPWHYFRSNDNLHCTEQVTLLTIVFDTIGKDQVHIIQKGFTVLIFVFRDILEWINIGDKCEIPNTHLEGRPSLYPTTSQSALPPVRVLTIPTEMFKRTQTVVFRTKAHICMFIPLQCNPKGGCWGSWLADTTE